MKSADDLLQSVTRLRDQAAEREKKQQTEKLEAMSSFKDGQLALWPEWERRIPNELVRSALFTARDKRKERKQFTKRTHIFSLGDADVSYLGQELRALDDELVWLQIVHYARAVAPTGEGGEGAELVSSYVVEFTDAQILKDLNWHTSKPYYEKLHACIDRMKAAVISVRSRRLLKQVECSLIRKTERIEISEGRYRWRIYLEPEMMRLFQGVFYTKLEWDKYLSLGQNVIAKRLDGWVRSHASPLPVAVKELQAMMGADGSLDQFRRNLKHAADLIKANGTILNWVIDDEGRLVMVRPTSKTIAPVSTDETCAG